ncbi:MAG: hypothetical protein ACFFB5_24880 [Promethearchaeota archaeon]
MPIYRIGRERESLMYSGEAYKKAVRRYLESMGYSETTDSYIEGHVPDMIFYNKDVDPGREFWVEAKGTKVTLSNRDFCKEVLMLLRIWLDQEKDRQFKLLIFIQEEPKKQKLDLVFGEIINRKFIKEWLNKNKSLISNDDWSFINRCSKKNIYSFFQKIKVFVGPAYKLEIAAEEKLIQSQLSPTRKAKLLLEESERRNHLIELKSNLVINLFSIQLPDKYLKIKSNCRTIDEIWNRVSEGIVPPFVFDGKNICTFCSIDEIKTLKPIIIGNPEYFKTQELLNSNPQELTKLVNFHLDKIMRCRGLRKYGNIYFALPVISEKRELKEKYIKSQTGRDRRIVRPIFDLIEEEKLYYVYHSAVKVGLKILWGKTYIQILPTRHFTSDGKIPIEGDNKDRLDRKYRNPIYNRSVAILSRTRLWKYYLFDRAFIDPQQAGWFKNFKFGELESISLIGIPKSIDKDQKLILDYTEEIDDN